MGDSPNRPLAEELAHQSDWMRKLVRRLLRDGSEVDDVVQEAHLAALHRRRGGETVPRGWLARVVINFARKRGRDDASRRRIERDSARTEAEPPADELASRLDAQRALADELRALAEPYRSTLVRHYFDGWSAARIARESDVPATTVRTRLERGLELLRERLDRRSGGRRHDWMRALAPLVVPHVPRWLELPSAPTVSILQGALLMKGVLQVVAVVSVAVIVGVGLWWSASSPEAASPNDVAPPTAELEALAPTAPSTPTEREVLEVAEPAETTRERDLAPNLAVVPASGPCRIEARVVDSQARPIAGALVVLGDGDELEHVRALSERDGTVRLEWTPSVDRERCMLAASAPHFGTRFVEVRATRGALERLGDIELGPGGAVSGRVQDHEGRPIGGARVIVTKPELPFDDLETAKRRGVDVTEGAPGTLSLADGSFSIDGIAPGGVRAFARVAQRRYGVSEPLTVRADQVTADVVLVVEPLRPEDEIAGIVLKPDGEPASGASLMIQSSDRGGSYSTSQAIGSDGRFRFRVPRIGPHELSAFGGAEYELARLEDVMPGTHDVVLRFVENRYLTVTARSNGELVRRMRVRTLDALDDPIQGSGTATFSNGSARVRVPNQSFRLEIAAPGCALALRGPFEHDAAPETIEVELAAEAGLTGVVTADANTLAGARVSLWRVAGPESNVDIGGYPSLIDPRIVDEFVTDDDGVFFLRVREAGEHLVRAESGLFARAELGPLQVAPAVAYPNLELALGVGGRIEGRVRVAPGRSEEGVLVVLNRGDGLPRTVRTGIAGAFVFERVTAGRCFVGRGRTDVGEGAPGNWAIGTASAPTEIPFNCEVAEGRTTRIEIDLRDERPSQVGGHLSFNGVPARGWTLKVWPGDTNSYNGTLPSTAVDEHGNFEITLEDPGPARFSFSPPDGVGIRGHFDFVTQLVRGENVWRENVAAGRIEGRAPCAQAADYEVFFRQNLGDRKAWLNVDVDNDGRFVLPFVFAGAGKFTGVDIVEGKWGTSSTLSEVSISVGETVRVELP